LAILAWLDSEVSRTLAGFLAKIRGGGSGVLPSVNSIDSQPEPRPTTKN
jgi:hypothetical protein